MSSIHETKTVPWAVFYYDSISNMKQSFEIGPTPSGAESTEKISEEEKASLLEAAKPAKIKLRTDDEFGRFKDILKAMKAHGIGHSSEMTATLEDQGSEAEKSEELETGALESQPLIDRIRALVALVDDVDEKANNANLSEYFMQQKAELAKSIDETLRDRGLGNMVRRKTGMEEWHALMDGSHEAEEVPEEVRDIVLEKIGEFVDRMETELPKKAPMSSVA